MDLQVYIVESNMTEQRHIERKDNQSDKFIKGRVTKTNNIKYYLGNNYITLVNNKEADIQKNFKIIIDNYNNFRGI